MHITAHHGASSSVHHTAHHGARPQLQQWAGAGGRNLVCALSFAYICGWSIFPIVWTFGHSGINQLSDQACNYFQMVGDLLAKRVVRVEYAARSDDDDQRGTTEYWYE